MLSVIKNGFKRVLTGIHGCQMFTLTEINECFNYLTKNANTFDKTINNSISQVCRTNGHRKKVPLEFATIHFPFQLVEGDREVCVGCKAPFCGRMLKPKASQSYCLCKWRQKASRALLNQSIILKAEKQRNLNNLKPFVTFKKSIRFQKGVHYSSLESILFLII